MIILIIIFIIKGDLLLRPLYDQLIMTTTVPNESEICCESQESWPLQIKSVVLQPRVSLEAFFSKAMLYWGQRDVRDIWTFGQPSEKITL